MNNIKKVVVFLSVIANLWWASKAALCDWYVSIKCNSTAYSYGMYTILGLCLRPHVISNVRMETRMTNIDQLIDRVLRPYFYLIKEWGHNSLTDSVKLAKALRVAVDALRELAVDNPNDPEWETLQKIEKIAGGGE